MPIHTDVTSVSLHIASTLGVTYSNLFFGTDTEIIEQYPLTEEFGELDVSGNMTIHGSRLGTEAEIKRPEWTIANSKKVLLELPIFDSDFNLNQTPTDALQALYVDASGTPIKHSGNWSSYGKEDIFRNPDCWISSKALTCFSVWSDISTTSRFPLTLLSPRHFLCNAHVTENAVGSKAVFCDLNNAKQEVAILAFQTISADLQLGILDQDITIDVEYAKLLPESWTGFYDANPVQTGFLAASQSKEGILAMSRWIQTPNFAGFSQFLAANVDVNDPAYAWGAYVISTDRSGDSQRPVFVVNGDDLFLLFTATAQVGQSVTGVDPFAILADIQTAMDDYDTTYSRTPSYTIQRGKF
jgi:hypothetical protein